MPQKPILVPERLRRPPATGWSWVDRRFLREHWPISRARPCCCTSSSRRGRPARAVVLQRRHAGRRLRLSLPVLEQARRRIAGPRSDRPSVAAWSRCCRCRRPACSRRPEPGQGLMQLGDLFRQVAAAATSDQGKEHAMNVALWAEIRRLAEIEKLSGRAIARRLHCSRHTVAAALKLEQPPAQDAAPRASLLDRTWSRSRTCWPSIPTSRRCASARRSPADPRAIPAAPASSAATCGQVRPARGRVYQEVHYEPAQAMQVDWGECGRVQVGATTRKVSVFVAVLCYSRLMYIEFTLSQRKAEFYRGLVNALTFFGGSPRAVIFDNLKAAVLNGSGRDACFHPEFLALCGYFCLQPIACARRDPESKGIVEGGVRYVKHNALAGRAEELTRFEDYLALAPSWRDQVANVRLHETTRERPLDRFEQERALLRPLPAIPFDTDEVVPAVVSPHARIAFDGNRYSAPPQFVRRAGHHSRQP